MELFDPMIRETYDVIAAMEFKKLGFVDASTKSPMVFFSPDIPDDPELCTDMIKVQQPANSSTDIIDSTQSHPDHLANVIRAALLGATQVATPDASFHHEPRVTPSYTRSPKPTAYELAQQFVKAYVVRVASNAVYLYTGTHYQYCPPEDIHRLLVSTCRQDVETFGGPRIVQDAYSTLRMFPELAVALSKPSTTFLSTLSGLYQLSTGHLLPHTPDIFVTSTINATLLSVPAPCPHFDSFLESLAAGDYTLIERIWEIIGYCLTPDTDGKIFFLLQGCANSGKSKLGEFLASFFNTDAVTALELHSLSDRFAAAELIGKSLCLSLDLPDEPLDTKAVSTLKKLVGQDLVSADVKYQSRVKFYNTAKIIAATNHRVTLRSRDDALVDRIVVVPCKNRIPKENQDPLLLKRFESERNAIATKAILAYQRLRANHYRFSGNYQLNEALDHDLRIPSTNTFSLQDAIAQFITHRYVPDPDGHVFVEDAHAEFSQHICNISTTAFSTIFCEITKRAFDAKKARIRKPGRDNAQSCMVGLTYRGGEHCE